MTIPKVETITRGGSRRYLVPDPDGGDPVELPGVTSVLAVMDKPALPRWAALEVAKRAAELKDRLPHLDDADIVTMLKGAPWSGTRSAATKGTDVHDVVERLLRGEKVAEVPVDIATPVKSFLQLRREFDPGVVELEVTGVNLTHGYAGSLDAILTVNAASFLVDWKTSKQVYPEYALQAAAYRGFEFIIDPDGTRRPMPATVGALVGHLPKEPGTPWSMTRVASGPDEFDTFVALLAAWKWKDQHSRSAVGTAMRERTQLVPF